MEMADKTGAKLVYLIANTYRDNDKRYGDMPVDDLFNSILKNFTLRDLFGLIPAGISNSMLTLLSVSG
jgi:hypothetical protein